MILGYTLEAPEIVHAEENKGNKGKTKGSGAILFGTTVAYGVAGFYG